MLRTLDGYAVSMPRFRGRRLQRRLRTPSHNDPRRRAASRMYDLLIGRARRTSDCSTAFPVFATNLGLRRLQIVTRGLAPRRVELLYIRYAPRP